MIIREKFTQNKSEDLLNLKINLENIFINNDLIPYFRIQKNNVISGKPIDTIKPYLFKHYNRVFDKIVNKKLLKNLELNIISKYNDYILNKQELQSSYIDETTNIILKRSEDLAKKDNENIEDEILRKITAKIFNNYNKNRLETIAVTETQHATETIRNILVTSSRNELQESIEDDNKDRIDEIFLLSGDYTSYNIKEKFDILSTGSLLSLLDRSYKEWVTKGDKRVRPIHQNADGQKVKYDEYFIVGGEFLMHPGDTSLGASMKNISNCRCNAIY